MLELKMHTQTDAYECAAKLTKPSLTFHADIKVKPVSGEGETGIHAFSIFL